MSQVMKYDEAIVRSFIHPYKQERYLALLAKPTKRRELLKRLGHGQDLNSACMISLPKDVQTADQVVDFLKRKGASTECYIISEKHNLDGKILPIESAIIHIYANGYGSILFCFPRGVGYFEGEGKNDRYLLIQPKIKPLGI